MIESYHGNYGTISIWKFFPSITTNIHIVPDCCNYFVSLTFGQRQTASRHSKIPDVARF